MKKKTFLIAFMFFTVLSLSAQNYSPCYTSNMANGDAAFKQGKYSDAKTYYANAKKCNGGNPEEAQKKINQCNAKLNATSQPPKPDQSSVAGRGGSSRGSETSSVAYGTGHRRILHSFDATIEEEGQVFVEVHVSSDGRVIDARVINDERHRTTVTNRDVLQQCVERAKQVIYGPGKEELRIIVFS